MKNIVLLITLSLLSMATLASTGVINATVKGLGISSSSGTIYLDINESQTSASCTDKDSFRFKVSNPLYKEVYATLLTAKVANKTVTIAYSNDESMCHYNSPQIYSVYIK